MKKRHSMEMMERTEYLYCCQGHPLKAVAELTGVSLAALKRWSSKFGWAESRQEICRALITIRTNTILLRQKMLEKALESQNVKEAIAVLTMESLAWKEERGDIGRDSLPMPGGPCKIENDEDAAGALERAYRARIKLLAAAPGRIGISDIRGLKEAMNLAEALRTKEQPCEGGGLTDEAADEIRRKILGIWDPDEKSVLRGSYED